MAIEVRVTYDMSKTLGTDRFEVEGAATVADVVRLAGERFPDASSFAELSSRAAIAVNGVLASHRRGMKTPLRDGDPVTFVKSAAGG